MVCTRGASKKQAREEGNGENTTNNNNNTTKKKNNNNNNNNSIQTRLSLWEVWHPPVDVHGPVFDVENALVVPDITPEEYVQLSRRKGVDTGGGGDDSLELLLMDSLQNDDVGESDAQKRVQQGGAGDSVQKDQAMYLALESIGFESWKHFVDTMVHSRGEGVKRRKRRQADKVTLSDVLNGTSPYYHPRFSRAYQQIRKNLRHDAIQVRDIQSLQYHSALALSWSDLTAEEHSWYLMHQHTQLSGAEARRFDQLTKRIEKEKSRYMEEVRGHAEQHASRYEHMTERQNAQLFADDERKKGRIHALFPEPVLKRLDCVTALPVEDGSFRFVSVLHIEGQPLEMTVLEDGYSLPGDKHYLPAVVPLNRSDGIYTKEETVEIQDDVIVKNILKTMDDGVIMVATAGAFRALVAADCLGYRRRELEIPITVDTNVWYMGKPLMSKSMMAREKQARVQKYAVLSAASVQHDHHQRQTVYSLWRHSTTGVHCIVRSHSTRMFSGVPSVLSIKPEYLPLPDREAVTMEEVAHWSAAMCFEHPCGTRHMHVAHICVPRGKILSWSTLQLDQMQHTYPSMKQTVHQTAQGVEFESTTLASLVSYAIGTPPMQGTFLARAYTSECVWEMYGIKELSPGEEATVYNVHTAHHTSTSTDVHSSPWVPPIWRPYSDTIAQVPYTFPPYCATDVSVPKRRRVRRMPWRGDLDNPTMGPSSHTQHSNDYMEQYLQELE